MILNAQPGTFLASSASGKDCSSFEHKTCEAGGGGPGGGSGPGGGQPGGPPPEPPEECTDNPPEGGNHFS